MTQQSPKKYSELENKLWLSPRWDVANAKAISDAINLLAERVIVLERVVRKMLGAPPVDVNIAPSEGLSIQKTDSPTKSCPTEEQDSCQKDKTKHLNKPTYIN